MHTHDLARWQHDHVFDAGNRPGERGTRLVLALTVVTMVVEVAAGWVTASMALLADGLHMGSHVLAIGLSVFAYAAARRLARDPRYAFGTWKIEVLAGFASAIFLLGIAGLMVIGSVERLLRPQPIQYAEAMLVAALGLLVNLVSARILGAAHHHGQGDPHDAGAHHGRRAHPGHHGHRGHHDPGGQPAAGAAHHDLNLRSAYLHVLADAATSVAAIVALAGGWWLGWSWLDPVMAIVGAAVVAVWAKGLIVETGAVLLDREMDHPVVDEIREVVAAEGAAGQTEITDLHVWRVGRSAYSCALSLLTHDEQLTPDSVRGWLAVHEEIVHATIEIRRCPEPACAVRGAAA
jgi:cation diffusion facilitator family transporter